jgi:DNA (cytosine-5)-methyltransferase 1
MKVGSLFSGIGGLDLGLERAGMEVIWQVENDPYCIKVLKKHWPNVRRHGDIREIDWSEVERPDLVCGGFPCQPCSVAGKRLGQADDRWLWPEFRRCLFYLRPQFVLVENVPGLLARGMGDVLGDLAGLGYDTEWESLPAAAVGAPHLRYRVFIVAHSERNGLEGQQQAGTEARTTERVGEVADTEIFTERTRLPETEPGGVGWRRLSDGDWWAVEPAVGRVVNGVPSRVDRLRALGNAVVPQVAEWIGRRIMEVALETDHRQAGS